MESMIMVEMNYDIVTAGILLHLRTSLFERSTR